MNNKQSKPGRLFLLIFGAATVLAFAGFYGFLFSSWQNSEIDAGALAAKNDFGNLPLAFEANRGQTDESVKFLSRGDGYALFLTAREAVFEMRKGRSEQSAILRMRLEGGNDAPEISGENRLSGKSNYFVGNDPNDWKTDIPNFESVQYKDVYPGIDRVFYGSGRELEYDFIVAPEADSSQIALKFEGAEKLELNAAGELVLYLDGERIIQKKPFVYQEIDGERKEIAANYKIRNPKSAIQNQTVGFEIGEYQRSKPLVIDPVLVYSTYLGGNRSDAGLGIAIDGERNVYVTGTTLSPDFPTVNPLQANPGGNLNSVFVTKINAAGNAIVYSTYIGGSGGAIGHGIDTDNAGNVYVTGTTGSGFPTTPNAFDTGFNGTDDAFLLKINAGGSALSYSTYLGGNNTDIGFEVKVNKTTGEAFVAGNALSNNFPTTPGAFRTDCAPTPCVSSSYVTKLNAAGSALVYSTYIGAGPANDLAIDADGNAYIVGQTISQFFPVTPGAVQPTCTGCNLSRSDAFVTKLNPTGSALVYSTYLGGSIDDVGTSIALDAAGNAFVTGRTESGSSASVPFPTTPGAFQTTSPGIPDTFVTKLNPTGTAFVYSTFLGGNVRDEAFGIAVDPVGNAHVTGQTRSGSFPLVEAIQSSCTVNGPCTYISSLNASGSGLIFSTFFGQGRGNELVADNLGSIYITGEAFDGITNIPLMNPIQPAPVPGDLGSNAFVSKIQIQQIMPRRTPFDFDGDGKRDMSVFRPSNGAWYLNQSTNGFTGFQFGNVK